MRNTTFKGEVACKACAGQGRSKNIPPQSSTAWSENQGKSTTGLQCFHADNPPTERSPARFVQGRERARRHPQSSTA
eukprot:13057461-Ditylum_brightwellii.AAC.1